MGSPKSERVDAGTRPDGDIFLQNLDRSAIFARLPMVIAYVALLALWLWAGCPYQSGWFITNIYGFRPSSDETRGEYDRRPVEPTLSEPWNQITPSDGLVFHDCFGRFQCARLHLPMDWNATDSQGPRVTLAMVKLPAKVPVTDARYGGMLWLQDGGPGESSVDFALKQGDIIQMIVDSDLDPSDDDYDPSSPPKYFDVLGVDPRGINNSVPHVSCFPSAASRERWSIEERAEGLLSSSDIAFSKFWAREQALGKGCSDRIANSEDPADRLAFHVNTSPNIADLVAILELNGKWRETQVRHLIGGRTDEMSLEIMERTRWSKGEEKLLFWGFSYGTVVGATFAAMQPHRVQRLVVDGVVDTGDYYRGERLLNIQDADTILQRVSEHCDVAGPERCPLHTQGGPENITHRFYNILESLKGNPVGVPSSGLLAPDLVTYSDVKSALKSALYAPLQAFPTFVEHLVDLSNSNGTSFAAARRRPPTFIIPTQEYCQLHPYAPKCQVPTGSFGETRRGILCTDGNSTLGITRSDFEAFRETVARQSRLIGDIWPEPRMGCIAWDVKPKWRFPGPFRAVTSEPMLMIGTTTDPCTPLRNAYTLAEDFPGSAVLAVEAEGHCSLNVPSLCMARHLRAYFQQGRMPVSGTVCDADEKPWLGLTGKPQNAKEARLLERLAWMAKHFL